MVLFCTIKTGSIEQNVYGGIAETKEMLEFSVALNFLHEIEIINMQYINKAWSSFA